MSFAFNPLSGEFERFCPPIWQKVSFSIPASSSQVVYSGPSANFHHGDFIMNFVLSSTNASRSLKFVAVRDDASMKDQVYSRLGAAFSIGVSSQINGSNVEVTVSNNEASSVDLIMAQLIL